MPDSLDPLQRPPFSDAVKAMEELLSQSDRSFLLGAGCSRCAGLPLMSDLTKEILGASDLDEKSKAVLSVLAKRFEGSMSATIEDYMSELVDLLAIIERRRERNASDSTIDLGGTTYQLEDLQKALDGIKEAIVRCIDTKRGDIATHLGFIRAVHLTLRSGKASSAKPVDYFVLNYDTLIEECLALHRQPYADGFRGGATGWWDDKSFLDRGLAARVFKLHGSIDWCELNDDALPRRTSRNLTLPTDSKKRVLIWPAATKYRETQRDPYAQILNLMRESLRPPVGSEVVLTICGYRFGDSHINLEIDRALRESRKALTLLIFTEQHKPDGKLKEWLHDSSVNEQVRIHAKRGFFHGSHAVESDRDLPWWRFETLTSLLGGAR